MARMRWPCSAAGLVTLTFSHKFNCNLIVLSRGGREGKENIEGFFAVLPINIQPFIDIIKCVNYYVFLTIVLKDGLSYGK